ncbi:hypothetical protein FHS51_004278, partial [Sphingobium wenxiniae]
KDTLASKAGQQLSHKRSRLTIIRFSTPGSVAGTLPNKEACRRLWAWVACRFKAMKPKE